jgi:hypothetical protein
MFEERKAKVREGTLAKVRPYLIPGEQLEEAVPGFGSIHPLMGMFGGILVNGVADYSSYRNTGHSAGSLNLTLLMCLGLAIVFGKPGIVAATSARVLVVRTDLIGRATGIRFETPRGVAVMALRPAWVVFGYRVLSIAVPDGRRIRSYVPKGDRTNRIVSAGSTPPPPPPFP